MEITPELLKTILDLGGAPALLGVFIWKAWNGTSARIRDIADDVREVRLEIRDGFDDMGNRLSSVEKEVAVLQDRQERVGPGH